MEEIYHLYAFLETYQSCGIKYCDTEEEWFKEHPELEGLKKCVQNVLCKKTDNETMEEKNTSGMKNVIHFVERKSNIMDLLYYLYDAIAHAGIAKSGNSVHITCFDPSYPIEFTARGCIDFKIINSFTNVLKKVEL